MVSVKSQPSSYRNSESWTDDLPVCKSTGIGYSTNQIYREDGHPQEEHAYEDCSCHFKFNDQFYWYALFDGHNGKRAAEFCCQRMTVEIYFSHINKLKTDEEVKEFLRQAIVTVENGYFDTLGDLLAERTSIQYDIPEGLSPYDAYKTNPKAVERIQNINCELSSGAATAVCLISKNKLYVANVGNCRALLCQTDANSVLKVVQLSVDHDLKNEDELLRLAQIGVDIGKLKKGSLVGNQESTRCLGNYAVKSGFKDFDTLSMANQEPVIAEPEIQGGILLDDSCRFLILMSMGLYKAVGEAIGTDQVNKYIAQAVVEQFREQATLTGVAQAVVDKVVRLHHDWYSANPSGPPKREDITLILRNFNFPLPNAFKSSTNSTVTFNPEIVTNTYSEYSGDSNTNTLTENTLNSTNRDDTTSSSINRTESDNGVGPDQKIEAYVDFTEFYENLKKAQERGLLIDQ